MKDEKIIEKIRKLLALSESDNESEAKSAMKKAKMLMARHNLDRLHVLDNVNQEVVEVLTNVEFNDRKNSWIPNLAAVISRNYRCEYYFIKPYMRRTRIIGFVGFEEDVEICRIIFEYALKVIWTENVKYEKQMNKEKGWTIKDCRPYCNAYAIGFIDGIRKMYEQQAEEHQEWGLVMVIPKEVIEVTNGYSHVSLNPTLCNISSGRRQDGYNDGIKFDPSSKLDSQNADALAIQ